MSNSESPPSSPELVRRPRRLSANFLELNFVEPVNVAKRKKPAGVEESVQHIARITMAKYRKKVKQSEEKKESIGHATKLKTFVMDKTNLRSWDDLTALLNGLWHRFPSRKWPIVNEKRVFQLLESFLGMISGGHIADLLVRYFEACRAPNRGSHRITERRGIHDQVMESHRPKLLANLKGILEGCRTEYDIQNRRNDPLINSVRVNVLKALQSVAPRDDLKAAGFLFSNSSWRLAKELFFFYCF